MPAAPGVLLLDGAGQRLAPLAERLRALGFQSVRAKTPEEALQLVESPRYDFSAALLPPDLPVADLRGALAALRDRAARRLVFLAVGARPEAEGLARLRDAGVELSVWNPIDDGVLRFQLNRAVSSFSGESLRRELRAPTDWRVRFFSGGRPKDATLYSLSAGGAFLSTQRPSLRGAEVAVELPLPAESIAVRGRVLYTNVPGNLMRPSLPLGMAVEFRALGEDVVDSIRRSVAERSLALVV
ncbi:MAG TPA: PilZ domain-containing protein [Myxococcota bacterium]|jgi:DNA-binding response OmpR family regulator|nr:PilZ domain-containing protein [Myxococcota bacterium]